MFLAFLFISFAARAETCGQIAGVKGTGVEILRMQPGKDIRYAIKVEPSKAMPLECEDVVLAGRDSSAKIILANGKLSLGPESRIEIAAHTKAAAGTPPAVNLINLTYGKMRALIQKKTPQASFKVKTYSAVAGVRGTDFFTSYEPNSGVTEQATLEGSVEVQHVATQQKVLVEAGRQSEVEAQEPIRLTTIQESLKNEIRVASAVVKEDQDFAHAKAVEVLGPAATWTMEREKVPEKLNKLKNEF